MADQASNSGSLGPEPIDMYSLGRTPILCDADLEDILVATGIDLLPEIDRNKFKYLLNNAVERTIREQLRIRLQRKFLKKLTTSIRAYRDLSRSQLQRESPPPTLPVAWLKLFETWVEETEHLLATRRSGGASMNVEQMEFLPKALGLFHVGFGLEPSTSGATFRFVHAVSSRARQRVDERGFSEWVPEHLRAKARWTPVTDDGIAKRISAALKLQGEDKEWTGEGSYVPSTGELTLITRTSRGPAWQLHASQFRKMIANH